MTPMPSGSSRMVSSVTPGRMVGLMMPTTPRQLENGIALTLPKSLRCEEHSACPGEVDTGSPTRTCANA